jgi:hypothetical protein
MQRTTNTHIEQQELNEIKLHMRSLIEKINKLEEKIINNDMTKLNKHDPIFKSSTSLNLSGKLDILDNIFNSSGASLPDSKYNLPIRSYDNTFNVSENSLGDTLTKIKESVYVKKSLSEILKNLDDSNDNSNDADSDSMCLLNWSEPNLPIIIKITDKNYW